MTKKYRYTPFRITETYFKKIEQNTKRNTTKVNTNCWQGFTHVNGNKNMLQSLWKTVQQFLKFLS